MAKITNIINSYLKALPENEAWYKERMSICATCPFNSDNATPDKMSDLAKVVKFVSDEATCGACGCVIKRKASVKAESCGLTTRSDLGKAKWHSLEQTSGAGVSVESNDTSVKISGTKEGFVFDYGTRSEDVLDYTFTAKSKMKFKNVSVTCGCTTPEVLVEGDSALITLRLSTLKFGEGLNKRTVYLNYIDKSNNEKKVQISLMINKVKGEIQTAN